MAVGRLLLAGQDSAQHHLDARHHLAGTEGLGDVVVRAQLQPEQAVELLRPGAEHQNRHGRALANLPADREAILFRHDDVQYEHVRALLPDRLQRAFSIVSRQNPIIFSFKKRLELRGDVGIVVRNQHLVSAARIFHSLPPVSCRIAENHEQFMSVFSTNRQLCLLPTHNRRRFATFCSVFAPKKCIDKICLA